MKTGINLDALIVLDSIARRGSFAAAAKELYRVPSSITYAIQKLEDNLEVTLFDRHGHRAHLTPAGEALLREGRDLLALAAGSNEISSEWPPAGKPSCVSLLVI
jgi:DNA-binding transcriptional LysR family regulator